MFSNYLFVLLSSLVFFSGIAYLVWSIMKRKGSNHSDAGSGPDDDHRGEGGLSWDIDAPLDLPPGIYTLPSDPVSIYDN